MNRIIIFSCCILITACTENTWTSGYDYSGFKNGYQTIIKYNKGGYTRLIVNVSSKIYNELSYPLILNIYINNDKCSTKTILKQSNILLGSAFCEVNLGPGKHLFMANLVSTDDFKNISREKDLESNNFHGTITYTIDE